MEVGGESSGDGQALRVAQRSGVCLDRPVERRLDRHRVEPGSIEVGDEVCKRAVVALQAVAEAATHGEVLLGPVLQGRAGHRCTSGHGWASAATAVTSAAA